MGKIRVITDIMTIEELKQEIERIDRLAAVQKKQAYFKYVKDNARYKIGDIVSDSGHTIRVERISFGLYDSIPSIYYVGPILTKKGEPRKDGETYCVFESKII